MPQMLQVECHPYLTQELLIKHCLAKSIIGKWFLKNNIGLYYVEFSWD